MDLMPCIRGSTSSPARFGRRLFPYLLRLFLTCHRRWHPEKRDGLFCGHVLFIHRGNVAPTINYRNVYFVTWINGDVISASGAQSEKALAAEETPGKGEALAAAD